MSTWQDCHLSFLASSFREGSCYRLTTLPRLPHKIRSLLKWEYTEAECPRFFPKPTTPYCSPLPGRVLWPGDEYFRSILIRSLDVIHSLDSRSFWSTHLGRNRRAYRYIPRETSRHSGLLAMSAHRLRLEQRAALAYTAREREPQGLFNLIQLRFEDW